MIKKDGLYFGRFVDDGRPREEVRWPSSIHAITIRPSGSGKGTSIIVPNICSLLRSVFIVDPEAEALAITGRMVAPGCGRVLVINPFNVLANELPGLASHGYNPLTAINPMDVDFTDDCAGMEGACQRSASAVDGSFWWFSVKDLVTALVMHEKIINGKAANLANVRRLLTEPFTERGLLRTVEHDRKPLRSSALQGRSPCKRHPFEPRRDFDGDQ